MRQVAMAAAMVSSGSHLTGGLRRWNAQRRPIACAATAESNRNLRKMGGVVSKCAYRVSGEKRWESRAFGVD